MHIQTQTLPAFSPTRFLVARWGIFAILILAYMLVFFHRMAPAVVAGDLMRTFGTTGAALGSLAAMYFYIYTLMQIPAGVLADTLGARASVAMGNLVAGSGSILFGMADTFWEASAGRALVGLGVSVVFVALFKSNSVWFSERRYGMVSGLALLFGNLGAIASAGPLALVLEVHSWRSVFVALGVVTLVLAALTLLLVRNRPEDLGFPSVREMEGRPSHPPRRGHWLKDLRVVFETRAIWPVFWVGMGMVGGMLAFIGLWAIPYLRDVHDLDRTAAATYTSLTLAGFAVGSMLAGWISDRIGRRKPIILAGTLGYALICLTLLLVSWQTTLVGMTVFFLIGFFSGGFIVTFANAKENLSPNLAGMAIGLVNTGLFLGAAIMQPLFGWVMDLGWAGTLVEGVRVYAAADYRLGFSLMFGFALLAVVGASRVHETHCQGSLPVAETNRGD
ncbi:MFS transporter [Geoalkalibacter sp.]|uniref:MFS transporter n=1 Tax=Geoalkalibacter sp. TaxID=3041440 RepID=UPI00272DE9D1|nr:MFS transporter [Geoalkalibacter sp.]